MKTSINKEQIEAILSETYLNAKGFVCNDKGVELDYDKIVDDQVNLRHCVRISGLPEAFGIMLEPQLSKLRGKGNSRALAAALRELLSTIESNQN